MSDYQQHSQNFKLTTRKNTWDCRRRDEMVGEEVWQVAMVSLGHPGLKAEFTLPKTWGRTMVFQYIDSLEKGAL